MKKTLLQEVGEELGMNPENIKVVFEEMGDIMADTRRQRVDQELQYRQFEPRSKKTKLIF